MFLLHDSVFLSHPNQATFLKRFKGDSFKRRMWLARLPLPKPTGDDRRGWHHWVRQHLKHQIPEGNLSLTVPMDLQSNLTRLFDPLLFLHIRDGQGLVQK